MTYFTGLSLRDPFFLAPALQQPAALTALTLACRRALVAVLIGCLAMDLAYAQAAAQTSDDVSAKFTRGALTVQARDVQAFLAEDRVKATGHVTFQRQTDRFSGQSLEFNTLTQTGVVEGTEFVFGKTGAGGKAQRIEFLGPDLFRATRASYSSCPIEDNKTPAWELSTRKLTVNMAENEGVAEAAVLRFYGVPLLAAPLLSFPVTEERKSGVLAPLLALSNTSGFEFGLPYYLNLAPNHDATLTPIVSTRRGAGLDSEFRYLTPHANGATKLFVLPSDQERGDKRWSFNGKHDGRLTSDVAYEANWLRVSDDNYWRDGLRGATSTTPRLFASQALIEQRRTVALGVAGEAEHAVFGRLSRWQLLQDLTTTTRLEEPYRRAQVGTRLRALQGETDWSMSAEVNHFTHVDPAQAQGVRAHMVGAVAWPLGDAGWRLTPRLGLNAAAYDVGPTAALGAVRRARVIPTFSLDSQWTFDRDTEWFGRSLQQTLEPRVLYVNTPWRDQSDLPVFDSAPLDFNPTSVYLPSAFSGVDRVSDAHQVTTGVTTRFLNPGNGSELARFGIAQRYLFRDQRVTADGVPLTQHFSDILLFGATSVLTHWQLDSVVQYNPEVHRVARSILNLRYSPGPFRTINTSYRLQRGVSEQVTVGAQWPLWGRDHVPLWSTAPARTDDATPAAQAATIANAVARTGSSSGSDCNGTLYGIGRLEYSLYDRRWANSILGLEYDAGCWIGRVIAQRKATGLGAQTTSLSVQLELIGLTRIDVGGNPLTMLKDNIPGFRLLHDPAASATDRTTEGGGAAR